MIFLRQVTIVPLCFGFKTVRHQSSSCFSAKMYRLNETIYHNREDFFYHFLLPIKHYCSIDFHTDNIDRCRKPELIRQITLLKTGSKVIMTKVMYILWEDLACPNIVIHRPTFQNILFQISFYLFYFIHRLQNALPLQT